MKCATAFCLAYDMTYFYQSSLLQLVWCLYGMHYDIYLKLWDCILAKLIYLCKFVYTIFLSQIPLYFCNSHILCFEWEIAQLWYPVLIIYLTIMPYRVMVGSFCCVWTSFLVFSQPFTYFWSFFVLYLFIYIFLPWQWKRIWRFFVAHYLDFVCWQPPFMYALSLLFSVFTMWIKHCHYHKNMHIYFQNTFYVYCVFYFASLYKR